MKKFRSFEDARKFAQSLNLQSSTKWRTYCKSDNKPDDIPSTPNRTYKIKGWKGYGDWLGTGNVLSKEFCSFEDARKFVHSLNLKSANDWRKFYKSDNKPNDIPAAPNETYKDDGWISWGDWLGTRTTASYNKEFRNFEDARKFVQSLKLKNDSEWRKYCNSNNRPDDIPVNPNTTYKNKGWKNLGDWLGTGRVASQLIEYRSFEDAKKFVESLKLNSQKEWRTFCKSGNKPNDITASPHKTYKNKGWTNLGDWLGTGRVAAQLKQFRSFEDAKKYIHSLNLKSTDEWKKYVKSGNKPDDIPADPWWVYRKNKKRNLAL